MTFQNLILKLSEFWASRGCVLQQPLDVEVGAGTMHPETFLRVLGPAHWSVAYVQPSRRPTDGRFGRVEYLHVVRRKLLSVGAVSAPDANAFDVTDKANRFEMFPRLNARSEDRELVGVFTREQFRRQRRHRRRTNRGYRRRIHHRLERAVRRVEQQHGALM